MVIEFTNKLFNLKDFIQYSNTFIETGTSMGDGVQRALDAGFKQIRSIEADLTLHELASKRFQSYINVGIWRGESIYSLEYMLSNKMPYVIFLDAHPAGVGSFLHEEWVQTKKNFQDLTIKAELDIILANYNRHVIIIDDMDGLNPFSQKYIDKIFAANLEYIFRFYDENLTGNSLYKNKILAAIV